MARAIIDRFEGELAVLEVDGRERTVARSLLPEGAREGDAVDLDTLQVDAKETEAARARARTARERAKKNPFSGGKL